MAEVYRHLGVVDENHAGGKKGVLRHKADTELQVKAQNGSGNGAHLPVEAAGQILFDLQDTRVKTITKRIIVSTILADVKKLRLMGYNNPKIAETLGQPISTIKYVTRKLIRNGEISSHHKTRNEPVVEYKPERGCIFLSDGRDLLFSSEKGKEILGQINAYKDNKEPMLIVGKTGTGKDLVARALHDLSDRKSEPFIALNCSAIPHELYESTLFGHEPGAFTGATKKSQGAFRSVGRGTLFLDEVTEIPLTVQAKFLKVLEDRNIFPVGWHDLNKPPRSEGRVIMATNKDLGDQSLRDDLFYRITEDGFIHIPPLDERKEDIIPIANSILKRLSNDAYSFYLLKETDKKLLQLSFPGNVRELKGILKRACSQAYNHNRLNGNKQEIGIDSELIERCIIKLR